MCDLSLCFRHLPLDEPIDLLNVAFENPRKIKNQVEGNIGALPKRQRKEHDKVAAGVTTPIPCTYLVPDRISGLQELEEFRRLYPGRLWNFVSSFNSHLRNVERSSCC